MAKKWRRVKTHRFNGVKFRIQIGPFLGLCDSPDATMKKQPPMIVLPLGLPYGTGTVSRVALDTLIHESLHASHWGLHEDTVDRMATEISSLLNWVGSNERSALMTSPVIPFSSS